MVHALSIDVEDWYHDFLLDPRTPRASGVKADTLGVPDILKAHGVRATFFFLGEVADHFPALVRHVATAGHEVGSHGYRHYPRYNEKLPRPPRSDDGVGTTSARYRCCARLHRCPIL